MASSPPLPIKVYLAGPEVFLSDALAIGARLKAICNEYSMIGLFPMDNAIPEHIFNPEPPSSDEYTNSPSATRCTVPAWIREENMKMIRNCDVVVANMIPFRGPSMDAGTAYEMGAAAALGKVVIGYSSDARSYVQKVIDAHLCVKDNGGRGQDGKLWDKQGWSVEEFEGCETLTDNLMMACGVDNPGGVLCKTADEALRIAHAVVMASRRKSDNLDWQDCQSRP